MKTIIFTFIFNAALLLNAQDYQISFSATGTTDVIETLEIKNLTQGTTIEIDGSDILHLVEDATAIPNITNFDNAILVYPNPNFGNCMIEYTTNKIETIYIGIVNSLGTTIAYNNFKLTTGKHIISTNNLPDGLNFIYIKSQNKTFAKKVLSKGNLLGKTSITYQGYASLKQATLNDLVKMQFNNGDELLVNARSGPYSTFKRFVPTATIVETFEFVNCEDGDGNKYGAVMIGDQLWMAENLSTTKYSNGSSIDAEYIIYNNNANNEKDHYGALYTYNAATQACPTNWHLPSQDEWQTLTNKIEADGYASIVGHVLKTTTGWDNNGNGTDAYGFSTLPAGMYGFAPDFYYLGERSFWWSSTLDINENSAIHFYIYNSRMSLDQSDATKTAYFSVRCVRD